MNAIEVVQNNFNNWVRHDAEAIIAAYAEGATYTHPSVDQPLTGHGIGDSPKGFLRSFRTSRST